MWWKRKEPPDHDAELRSLMKQYNAQVKSSTLSSPPPIIKPQPSPGKQVSTSSKPEELIQGQYISYTPTEANLHADEELCDTFRHIDEWFHHHLPLHMGSDYYRYGFRRSPVPYWNELQFCLSTKRMPPLEARIALGRHRAEKLAKLRREGSSEDVWEIRKEPLKNPFPMRGNKMTDDERHTGQIPRANEKVQRTKMSVDFR